MYLLPFHTLLLAAMLLVLSSTSVMAATVSVAPSGNGVFSVQGSGMDGVAGLQLDITYDVSLGTPTVTQGGLVAGAMLAANTSRPGLIKIAIISTNSFSGSGQIATISFASKSGSGGITSITTSMIDSKGSALASSANNSASTDTILTAGIPFSQTTTTQQQSTVATTTATLATNTSSSATATYAGTITLPTDLQQRTDQKPAPTSTAPVYSGEPAPSKMSEQKQPPETTKSLDDSKAEATPQFIVYKGISERFKLYNGSKNLSAIVTLFDKKIVQTIQQEPSILLSNGQSKATLTVDIPSQTSSSPNFAVNGGKLASFKQDKQSVTRWIIEVLPEVGAVRVTVTIIAGTEEFEFPLTVAPPVNTMLTLDEKGWNRFMKEVGTTKAPLHDLNNDGVRDYLDEYIFVANYLSNKTTPAKAKAGVVKVPKNK